MGEFRYKLRDSLARLWARLPVGSKRVCCLCSKRVGRFLPYKGGSADAPALARALDVVGSDLDHHECPFCGCHDRERHLLLYLRASSLLGRMADKRILHLAPEKHLRNVICGARPLTNVLGDLFPASPEIASLDVESLPFPAESFDFVIANHLLEHVGNLNAALTEIARVLSPGGYAILQTPFSSALMHTFEDEGIDTPYKRLQAYGQEDHVRLFGRDFVALIERRGFQSLVRSHAEILPNIGAGVYGVNPNEPFMLFVRSAEHLND